MTPANTGYKRSSIRNHEKFRVWGAPVQAITDAIFCGRPIRVAGLSSVGNLRKLPLGRRPHVADSQVKGGCLDRNYYKSDNANNDDRCHDYCNIANDICASRRSKVMDFRNSPSPSQARPTPTGGRHLGAAINRSRHTQASRPRHAQRPVQRRQRSSAALSVQSREVHRAGAPARRVTLAHHREARDLVGARGAARSLKTAVRSRYLSPRLVVRTAAVVPCPGRCGRSGQQDASQMRGWRAAGRRFDRLSRT